MITGDWLGWVVDPHLLRQMGRWASRSTGGGTISALQSLTDC